MTPRPDADDPRSREDDPTGIRALLSSLPDPGPMPPDLVDRITAALITERAARSGSPDLAPPTSPGLDDLAARRAAVRRGPSLRSLRWMAAAAAVLGVVVLGSLPLVDGQATWAALFTGAGDSSPAIQSAKAAPPSASVPDTPRTSGVTSSAHRHETARVGQEPGGSGSAAPSEPATGGQEAPPGGASVAFLASGHRYTAATLGHEAGRLDPTTATPQGLTGSAHAGLVGTAKGARACASALGVPSGAPLVVDVATYAGKPAAVILVTTSTGSVAFAVERSCTTGSTGLLAGPALVG